MRPFIVYALPRSRTAWLARFLTYGDWVCGHDELRHCRTLDDVKSWLAQPSTGTVETTAAPFWRLVQRLAPDIRTIVIRRPVGEVVESLLRAGAAHDRDSVTRAMAALDRKLEQIERRVSGTLSVSYEDLAREELCAEIFTRCLPYPHNHGWWQAVSAVNIQVSMPALVRYCRAYLPQLQKLAKVAKQKELAALRSRPVALGAASMSFQQESFDTVYRDGKELFANHLVAVGEAPDAYDTKNVPLMRLLEKNGNLVFTTARCNGRLFGYLMAIMGPSLEEDGKISALHTLFYASPDVPGLGLRLQRASIEALSRRGVGEVLLKTFDRGLGGDRIEALYQRLGADRMGHLYRLELQE